MAAGPIEMDLARLWHGDVAAMERDLDGIIVTIVVAIVAEAGEPDPIGLDLIAKLQRGCINLDRLALQLLADAAKKLASSA